MTKYRYTVVAEGVCEADTPAEAAALALWELDNGLQDCEAVQVEQLGREGGEKE